jgi:adenylylsulfate kinase
VTNPKSDNIAWSDGQVSKSDREHVLGQRGSVVWFTGFSGSGKSTLARALEERLVRNRRVAYVLDGDNIRHGLNSDLGFSPEDRQENIRRIGEVAGLFADAGVIVITAFISPYTDDRRRARKIAGEGRFVEVFLDVALEVCETRDPKNLYKKARAGQIGDFTGISAPYEKPERPEVVIDTSRHAVAACIDQVLAHMESRGLLIGGPGKAAS